MPALKAYDVRENLSSKGCVEVSVNDAGPFGFRHRVLRDWFMSKDGFLAKILKRHAVDDAEAYLETAGASARIARSLEPEVRTRGNVQMMKDQKINRKTVEEGFRSLKYL